MHFLLFRCIYVIFCAWQKTKSEDVKSAQAKLVAQEMKRQGAADTVFAQSGYFLFPSLVLSHTHVHTHTYTRIHKHIHTHTHTQIGISVRMLTHTHTLSLAHTHTHILIHRSTCATRNLLDQFTDFECGVDQLMREQFVPELLPYFEIS